MHPRTPARRWLTAAWAVLLLLLPLAAAFADARQAARAGDVRAHVEDAPSEGCAPAHATDCAACKQLSTTSLPGGTAALVLPDARAMRGAIEAGTDTRSARRGAALARAPPTPC